MAAKDGPNFERRSSRVGYARTPSISSERSLSSKLSHAYSELSEAALAVVSGCQGFRVIILVVSTVALTFAMANPLVLNFTIICMCKELANSTFEPPDKDSEPVLNPIDIPLSEYRGIFSWSTNRQSMAISSFAWGALLAIVPLSLAMQKFGARRVFTFAGVIGGSATVFAPPAALAHYKLFIFCRVLQGIGYSATLPMLAAMVSRWAPGHEAGRFMGLGATCFQLSPAVAMPIGGLACTSPYGWPLAYYVVGTASVAISIAWAFVYRDSPLVHPWLSSHELSLIMKRKLGSHLELDKAKIIPYKSIFRTPSVWAIVFATIGNMTTIYFIIYFFPYYLRQIMNFDLRSMGLIAATPTLCQAAVKPLAGFISDKTKCCWKCRGNETAKGRIFNCVAFLGSATFLVGLTFISSSEESSLSIVLFCLACAILGFSVGSFYKSVPVVGQMFSSFIMGLVQLTTCSVIVVLPFIIKPIIAEHSLSQWRLAFFLVIGVLLFTNIIFCLFGSLEPAEWAKGSQSSQLQIAQLFDDKPKLISVNYVYEPKRLWTPSSYDHLQNGKLSTNLPTYKDLYRIPEERRSSRTSSSSIPSSARITSNV